MTYARDPRRSLDDPELPEAWRQALAHGCDDGPSAEQLARLSARVLPALGAAAAGSQAAAAGAGEVGVRGAGLRGAGVKAVLVALGLCAIGGAYWLGRSSVAPASVTATGADRAAMQRTHHAPMNTTPAEPVHVPVHAPVAPSTESAHDEQALPSASSAAAPAPAPTSPAVRSRETLRTAAGDELTLLRSAQRQLTAAPARALELAQAHAARFPDGVLREERELIAIIALLRQGARDDAQRRADEFRRAYPRSVHMPRISALLADHNPAGKPALTGTTGHGP